MPLYVCVCDGMYVGSKRPFQNFFSLSSSYLRKGPLLLPHCIRGYLTKELPGHSCLSPMSL